MKTRLLILNIAIAHTVDIQYLNIHHPHYETIIRLMGTHVIASCYPTSNITHFLHRLIAQSDLLRDMKDAIFHNNDHTDIIISET